MLSLLRRSRHGDGARPPKSRRCWTAAPTAEAGDQGPLQVPRLGARRCRARVSREAWAPAPPSGRLWTALPSRVHGLPHRRLVRARRTAGRAHFLFLERHHRFIRGAERDGGGVSPLQDTGHAWRQSDEARPGRPLIRAPLVSSSDSRRSALWSRSRHPTPGNARTLRRSSGPILRSNGPRSTRPTSASRT